MSRLALDAGILSLGPAIFLPAIPPIQRTAYVLSSPSKRPQSSPSPSPPRHHKRFHSYNLCDSSHKTVSGEYRDKHSNSQISPQTTSESIPSVLPSTSVSQRQDISDERDVPDPLTPLPPQYVDRYLRIPTLKYYTELAPSAAEEFKKVSKPIVQFLNDRKYISFFTTMTHIGYEESSAIPSMIACARNFTKEDANEVISIFHSFACKSLQRIFCYEGSTSFHGSEVALQRHQQSPEMGSSIGPTGLYSSFSLGVFFHFDKDPEQYCISVHHGISSESTSTTPSTTPLPTVQQPSYPDHSSYREELVKNLQDAVDGGTPRNRDSPARWQKRLDDLDALQTHFATATMSELKVIAYQNRRINSDWIVMKVENTRHGNNYFTYPVREDYEHWFPRDSLRVYIVGIGPLQCGIIIMKSGRKTGVTEAAIDFIYANAKLEDSPEVTEEFTVISESPLHIFSASGDSGAAVIDEDGSIVGMILGGTEGAPMELKGHEALGPVWVTYVTPIQAVIQRIEEVTGKSVTIDKVDLHALEEAGVKIIRRD